jgi:hypothetical protein
MVSSVPSPIGYIMHASKVLAEELLSMEMVIFVSKFYIAINYPRWNKLKDPGIPAHLSVTRTSFEIDVKQKDLEEKCLRFRIEEK